LGGGGGGGGNGGTADSGGVGFELPVPLLVLPPVAVSSNPISPPVFLGSAIIIPFYINIEV
jgi:hypothetical protein